MNQSKWGFLRETTETAKQRAKELNQEKKSNGYN